MTCKKRGSRANGITMQTKLKTFWRAVLFCTPIGYFWGFWHTQSGVKPGWVFPSDAYSGIEFGGMILEDWLFYPITGAFFVTLILFDPLKKLLDWTFRRVYSSRALEDTMKWCVFTALCWFNYFCIGVFGDSGTMSAIFYGVPAMFLLLYIWHDYDVWHFSRTALIVIPMEFLWDHWAVGCHQQWVYLKDSGVFSHLDVFWFRGIALEMSPGLGILATYFIFSITIAINKLVRK